MRLAGVSGIADPCQYLAAPHSLSRLHAQAARLQVHVVCELPATQVECDGVTGKRFDRYRYGRAESLMAGHIFWKSVSYCNYCAIGHRQHRLAVRVVRKLVECIAGERRTLFDLH